MPNGGAGRRLALAAVLGASVLLDAWGLGWGLAGDYSWAPDELLPSAVRSGLHQRLSGGWHEKYGPLHYPVLAAAHEPAPPPRLSRLLPVDSPHPPRIPSRPTR